jgi:low affinity Fe/Cu permease
MRKLYEEINKKFLKLADAVSFGMGTPTNIFFWLLAVGIWFFLGITQKDLFLKGKFLPEWFTSNAWNFPLNTITTLAELYIGFLVAAATNRAERELRNLIERMKYTMEHVEKINTNQNKILDMLLKYEKQELKEEKKIYEEVKKNNG